ncbi:MAG: PPC domain-containing protein [Anaerolineae bacterium]|nr:PPC domain-containing protein [Anaerolineae bacterium]
MNTQLRYRLSNRPIVRQAGLALLACVLCVGLLNPAHLTLPAVQAQDDEPQRQLTVGDIVTGTLDSETFVQIYSMNASPGDVLTVDATTEVAELALVVVLTDQSGNPIAQDIDQSTPTTATITGFDIPTAGTYYILVMRGSGASGEASGEFKLQLSGVQQVGGQTVTLDESGIVVELGWSAAVNLNLEVRDPVGGAIHAFSPGSPSGGTLDADINANCDAATPDNPTERIAWPVGDVPAGSYEIIIYYVDGCTVGGPQLFELSTAVNGEDVQRLSGTLNPGQQYLARLVVEPSGTWTLQNGGVNAGLNISLFNNQIANADPIVLDSTVSGIVTNNAPAQAYTFEAAADTDVNIALQAQTGSLDTYLILLGPDNNVLASNDDFEDSTQSIIERNLVTEGIYTVIATRYGLTIGGTEGEYTLTLATLEAGEETVTTETGTPEGTGETEEGEAVELPTGAITVKLTWLSNADVQLSVRDPYGDTVYDDQPLTRTGGVLELDGNRGCTDTTTTPVSYIYWPPSRLEPGVYEVEVWYQNSCEDTTPVNFGLTVDVQGQTIINTTQPTALDSHYMITFRVDQDGTATAGPGGFFDMANANSLNYQALLDTATMITYGGTVSGSITERQRFEIYSFEGDQGDIVTIRMDATGGTLDPALYLISPEGIQVDYNDDIAPNGENRNSAIESKALAFSGTYYVIATHYGLNIGGTEGTYNLTLVQD